MKVVCHGEALIDLVNKGDGRFYPFAGGAVFNLARASAAQGLQTFYLNPISRDRFGDMLRASLAGSAVGLGTREASALSTSLAIANLDADAKAHYSFYRTGVADSSLDAAELIQTTQALEPIGLACTGCLALTPTGIEATLGWLKWCKSNGIMTLIDVNMRRVAVDNMADYRNGVIEAIQYADIAKLSDEDAAELFEADLTASLTAKKIFELSPAQLVCFTQGRLGAQVVTRGNQTWQGRENLDIAIADTVGAGDCFTAGFIGALFSSMPGSAASAELGKWVAENPKLIGQALAHALATASLCVQEHGAAAPSFDQVKQWLKRGSISIQQLA